MSDNRLFWDISKLKNWDKNPREIKENDFERLKKQIIRSKEITGEYLYKPLLISPDGIVLGGNMRLRALKQLSIKDIWVNIVTVKNEQEMMEIALSDNDRAGYYSSEDLLEWVEKYPELKWADYAVDLKEPVNLQVLIDKFAPITEDDAPPLAEGEADSQIGHIYQLGRHRLMCGDSTILEDVEKLMDGMKADLVVTDPPYNTGMDKKAEAARLPHMFQDNLTPEQWQLLINESLANMEAVTKGECAFYVFIDWRNVGKLKEEMDQTLKVNNIIVWDKEVHGLGSDYKFTYEMCVVGKKGKPKIENRIGEDYRDIWRVQRKIGRNEDHATAKPIALLTKPIALLTKPIAHASKQDDMVLDLFGGSGSTLIACEQTNRICYMMELDPRYCDVIRKRYAKFIGKENEWKEITPMIV